MPLTSKSSDYEGLVFEWFHLPISWFKQQTMPCWLNQRTPSPLPVKPQNTSLLDKLQNITLQVKSLNTALLVKPQTTTLPVKSQNATLLVKPQNITLLVKPQKTTLPVKPQKTTLLVKPHNLTLLVEPQDIALLVKPQTTPLLLNHRTLPSWSNLWPKNHRLTLNLTKVETQLMVGKHYNLDRSRYFYVTLLDLEEPEESHREISELILRGHEQKRGVCHDSDLILNAL